MIDIVIYETDPAERFRVEHWSGYDGVWDRWTTKAYKTAEEAIAAAMSAKKDCPDDRFRVIEKRGLA